MKKGNYSKWVIGAIAALSISSAASAFELSSGDISEGHHMTKVFEFKGFGCEGENKSPLLQWDNAPEGTKSFAVTAYDPDAPTGSGWWHWVVTDIPATVSQLVRGAGSEGGELPKGSRSFVNDFGTADFGGACPPENHGMHRYQFTVWALPTEKIGLPEGASPALVGYMLRAKSLGSTVLTATYSR